MVRKTAAEILACSQCFGKCDIQSNSTLSENWESQSFVKKTCKSTFEKSPITIALDFGIKEGLKDYENKNAKEYRRANFRYVWMVQEWIPTAFSLGIMSLHIPILIVLIFFTWPIKYLNILLTRFTIIHKSLLPFPLLSRKVKDAIVVIQINSRSALTLNYATKI